MKIDLEPGLYIIAVSGGVDSVVLLDLLAKSHFPRSTFHFIVAHFDHGIRPDSDADCEFVRELSVQYGLKFEFRREELGTDASEELARDRRYKFLNEIKQKYGADDIITAHHRDDVIETAVINISRGTNRRGISSLASGQIVRPLLGCSKKQILDYANENNLSWREDSTNSDLKYLRNKVRAKLGQVDETTLSDAHGMISRLGTINQDIDMGIEQLFRRVMVSENSILRSKFIGFDYKLSLEILAYWLRMNKIEYDKRALLRLVVSLKTGKNGAKIDAGSGYIFSLSKNHISLLRS